MSDNPKESSPTSRELYLGNVLSSFESGVQLDLRVKLAIEFLKSPMFDNGSRYDAQDAITYALDVAEKLLTEAASRGLLKPLPDNGEINAALKHHIERSVAAAALQAEESNRAAMRSGRPMVSMPGMQ